MATENKHIAAGIIKVSFFFAKIFLSSTKARTANKASNKRVNLDKINQCFYK